MHSTDKLNDGYLGSGNRLRLAIRKHGKENFKREILEFCNSRSELINKEIEVVNLNEIAKIECMNLCVGGNGGLATAKHTTEWLNEKWKDPKYREKRSEEASKRMKNNHELGKMRYNTFTGKKHTEETKQKMSVSSKGMGFGKENSQFGTMWITDGVNNKKINKEDKIPINWKKGRILKSVI
jgi:hypothetical protein